MSLWRIAVITHVALLPVFVGWLVVTAFIDPDEGANIGAGIVALGIIAVSWVAAAGFAMAALMRRIRQPQ